MSLSHDGISSARALPQRPNLEHLRNEAKRRLDGLRATKAGAKLADAQFQLAREYGFASWRELKAEVERRADQPMGSDPVGDWIRSPADAKPRLALHVWRTPRGLAAHTDSPDGRRDTLPVDTIAADGGRLVFTMSHPSASILYEGRWDPEAEAWRGVLRLNGVDQPMDFRRGAYPPEPVVEGLDGLWDGVLRTQEPARITFRIRTDERGTTARCDSPDRSGYDLPVMGISREGRQVRIRMQAAAFEGELSQDGERMEAVFTRPDLKRPLPLTLVRRAPGAPPPAPPQPAAQVPRHLLARYAGRYRYERIPSIPLTIELDDGVLYVQSEGLPRTPLRPLGEAEFFHAAANASLKFDIEPSGEVTGLVFHQQGREFRARRE
jgi:hypothetical protein